MEKIRITNSLGWTADFTPRGATLTALTLNNDHTGPLDIVLAAPDDHRDLTSLPYFGVIVGRYANRIRNGRFQRNGIEYQLDCNEGPTTLHGGKAGLHQKIWETLSHQTDHVHFRCFSPTGESGFPGNLTVDVIYTWSDKTLKLSLFATTDQTTPVNLCQHHYFNLNGINQTESTPILNHVLHLPAEHFLAIDQWQVPTGELVSVENTRMDFREGQPIAAAIGGQGNTYTQATEGLDHCFITPPNSDIILESPLTKLRMIATSNQPAFQVYTGNALNQTPGKYGHLYGKHSGICLEAQLYPDGPNHPHFPNCFLAPEERYEQQTAFRFDFLHEK